jgi:hypothetical protein
LKTLPADGIPEYRSFVAAFVVLYKRASKLEPTTVKELDHLLWRLKSMPVVPE